MNQVRTFIAIEIPSDIIEKISNFQDILKKEQASIRWIKSSNIHITLKFLGNVLEEKIDAIANAVEVAVQLIKPFTIEISKIGTFPNERRPRIIWIGAQSGDELLKLLAKNIDNEVHKLGFEKEKRSYKAHLTIGRVKQDKNIAGVIHRLNNNENLHAGSFIADEVVVMRSDLHPNGSIYTPLKRIKI